MNTTQISIICLLIFGIFASFTSCTDDTEGCTDTAATNFDADADIDDGSCTYPFSQSLKLNFEPKVGTADFVEGNNYMIGMVDFKVDIFRFYMSGLSLTTASGSTVNNSEYFYFEPGTSESFTATDLQTGSYTGLSFDVGVDSATNHLDPASYPPGDPLEIKTPGNHWGWNAGYRFVRVDGSIDKDGDGTYETAMQYHIGTDNLLTNVSKTAAFATSNTTLTEVTIEVDIEKLFAGIDLAVDSVTHVGDNPSAAQAFVANIPSAFNIK